ncbi:MAG: SAM-dependent chlorinase/fluorinase [Acidobacteriota bacterium]
MEERPPIITMITDFGSDDHYVGSMKGVILWINPSVNIVDITHNVRPHDIMEGAFILKNTYSYFPPSTVHLVVIDPEVGTARRPIVVRTEHHYFVCPDNGILTFVLAGESVILAHEITAGHYRRASISPTFHGRDVFAPAAAWLSRGMNLSNFGDEIQDLKKIELPVPRILNDGRILGQVIHIDRFGNAILNVNLDFLHQIDMDILNRPIRIKSGNTIITELKKTYAEGEPGKPFFLLNSSNFLEIAMNKSPAASILTLRRGSEVQIEIE